MSLENLSSQLSKSSNNQSAKVPPVELWDPPFCGDIDLQIKADGTWFYNGTPFKRMALVKLFASVLKKENDDYFLVTPVEKVGITVEDQPFILTQWHWADDSKKVMVVRTNLDDEFELNADHSLSVTDDGALNIRVRRNLVAKVHRNVYYQWVDIAREVTQNGYLELVIQSGDYVMSLGRLE